MENFNIKDIPEMEEEELQKLINKLIENFNKHTSNFAETCYYVYKIWDYCKNSYKKSKDNLYYNSYKLLEKFGFDKATVSKLKNCYERFCIQRDKLIELKPVFRTFSPSKLYELLPLQDEGIYRLLDSQIISSDMTVKEIRQKVKELTNGESVAKVSTAEPEIDEAEIPLAYDPTKEYDHDYFKSKSKNQLLNMIWDLQNAYQKLKNKRK